MEQHPQPEHPRWLAAVALPCSDPIGLEATGRSIRLYAGPHFHWRVNVFDSTNTSCVGPWAVEAAAHVTVSHIAGYMTLFWKRVLVPSLIRRYDRIFILDNDVRLTPQLGFTPRQIDRWFAATNAMIVQPSVIASEERGRSGTGVRNHHAFTADCAAHQIGSPERLHVSRPEAYEELWKLLNNIPDRRLDTDTGLLGVWTQLTCLAFPRRPPVVLLNSVQVVHYNTHTIAKAGLDPQYNDPRAKQNNVLFYLLGHPEYAPLANHSRDVFGPHGCGVPAASLADLGLSTEGRAVPLKTQRQKAAYRHRTAPTCWPLLEDEALERRRASRLGRNATRHRSRGAGAER